MATDEMDQSPRQKSAREEFEHTAHSQTREKEQEIKDLKQEMEDLKQELEDLKQEIRAKEDLRRVEMELVNAVGTEVRSALDAKVQFLREEITSLRKGMKSRDQQMISLRDELKSLRSVQTGDLSSEIARAVAEGFSTFTPVIDGMKSMLLERLSATRAASRINSEDLESLRTALRILGPTPECDASSSTHPLATLLGNDSARAETFCDDRYEVQQEEQYIKVLKACIPENANCARKLEWKSATGKTLRKTFKGVEFPVSASNDVVLCVSRYSPMFELGALLGVELKKKLTWQGLRQAEVEFYLWSEQSIFPYVQLITDMEHGGVAIYCRSGRDVRILTLESMEGVRRFLKEFGNSLPPDLGQDDSTSKRLVCPDSLSGPARKKFKSSDLGSNSTGQQQDTSQTAGQVALWSMAARWKNNLHDVGNMRDFDDFGDFGDDVVHG